MFGFFGRAAEEPPQNMDGSYMLLPNKKLAVAPDEQRAEAAKQLITAADGDTTVEPAGVCSICLQVADPKAEAQASGWSLLGRSSQKAAVAVRGLQPCGHQFHKKCIDQWLSACAEANSGRCLGRDGLLQKLSCPNCRICPELDEPMCQEVFPKDTLEKLDATFKVSPENEYLYEVVRRIEQANQTRDPVTGRIRFFRPEDSVLSKMGKTGMYAVLILPAAMYYVVRAVLIPNSVQFMQAVWHYWGAAFVFCDGKMRIVGCRMKSGAIFMKDLTVRGAKCSWRGVTAAADLCHRRVCVPTYEMVLLPTGRGVRNYVLVPVLKGASFCREKVMDQFVKVGVFFHRVFAKNIWEKFMRPWGLTMWNKVSGSVGAVVRAVTQFVMKIGVSMLEVGFVIRDVLKTGLGKMRDGVRIVSGKIVGASKVVLLPVWGAFKAVGGKVHGAVCTVGGVVARSGRTVYDGGLKPALLKMKEALRVLFDALKVNLLQPVQVNVLRPLLAAVKGAVNSVLDMIRVIGSFLAQGVRAYYEALQRVYRDFMNILRQFYISLKRSFAGKQK